MDTLITNVKIVDGTGKSAYFGNVNISNGKISLLDTLTDIDIIESKEQIDGKGLTLCPGFIDSHSHSDWFLGKSDMEMSINKISQGVTSEMVGQCGATAFPISVKNLADINPLMAEPKGTEHISFRKYLEFVNEIPKIGNYAFLCGHSSIRGAVLANEDRPPTSDELEQMKALLTEAMEHGCLGMSSGLIYVPGIFGSKEELIELCKVIAPYGGIYATHMRNEGAYILDAVNEAIEIAETAGVPLVISHHKICGIGNWGLSEQTLGLVHAAIGRGVRITLDQYPYEGTETALSTVIPPHLFTEGWDKAIEVLSDIKSRETIQREIENDTENLLNYCGGFENVRIMQAIYTPESEGMSIAAYANSIGKSCYDTLFDLIIKNQDDIGAVYFCLDINEAERIYQDENVVVGSDGIPTPGDAPCHPRAFAAFTKPLTYFCKERGLVSFEEAVRKQSGLTAERWGLKNKGFIKEGFDADLVLIDEDKLEAVASYDRPRELSKGIERVWVAGVEVYNANGLTGEHPGVCILKS